MVCMSPDSFEVAAELGMGAMMFSQFPWESMVDACNGYKENFRSKQGEDAPPFVIADFISIDKDVKKAEEVARDKMTHYLMHVLDHYEMLEKQHFTEAGTSYQHYANAAEQMAEMGKEAMVEGFLAANLWGDPAMICDKMEKRRELIGDFETSGCFSYSSIPYDQTRSMMKMFAESAGDLFHSWERKIS